MNSKEDQEELRELEESKEYQDNYREKKPDENSLTDDQIKNNLDIFSVDNGQVKKIDSSLMSGEKKKNNIYAKLTALQNELKAPKNQYNNFGGYKYRNCEDILEAVKPLLEKYKLNLFMRDKVILIGARTYIVTTGILIDFDSIETIETQAMAREAEAKKGMDVMQITGATSSYARKYMLNALFLIDDTRDADSSDFDFTDPPPQSKAKQIFSGMNQGASPNMGGIPNNNKTIYQAIMKLLRESRMSKEQKIKIKKGADELINDPHGLQELLNSTVLYIQGGQPDA